MANSAQSLDEILAKHNGELGVTWEDPDVVTPDTKQAILRWVAQTLEEAKEQLPTSEQLTTKYGYHMPEKMYGYKLGLHDAREAIDQFEQNLLKALEEV